MLHPGKMDRWCELGVNICLYTAWRVDLVVRDTVTVHRQQLDRSSWGLNAKNCDDCYESTGFSLPLWQPMTLSSYVSLWEWLVMSPLQQCLCLQLRSPCHRGAIFKGALSPQSTMPAPRTGCHNVVECSGREGAWRQPHEKHWLSDPGTETVIHSWIGSWRRFTANLGRRGSLRSHKYLVLLAQLMILCKQNVLSC